MEDFVPFQVQLERRQHAEEGSRPPGDVAGHHDAYLAEAYAREGQREDPAP
jgi:hypothetical protein